MKTIDFIISACLYLLQQIKILQNFTYFKIMSLFAKFCFKAGFISVAFFIVSLYFNHRAEAFGDYSSEYFANIKQPIGFTHKTHVLDNGIACEVCHNQARRSDRSGTPAVVTCIGCHVGIPGTTPEQKAEISKISQYWKESKPIPWQKIHDLPDFVHFSHQAHLNIGFDCTNCHGDVSKTVMPVPQTYKGEIPLSMGWCVSCHRTNWPVTAAGKIAQEVHLTRGSPIIAAKAPEIAGHINGPTDCLVCHK